MPTYATGTSRLLKLLYLETDRGIGVYFWWDTDDLPYHVYGGMEFPQPSGHHDAIVWALQSGYSVTLDRVQRSGVSGD